MARTQRTKEPSSRLLSLFTRYRFLMRLLIAGVFMLIGIIAVIRVIVKAIKGEAVEIHQVGIVNELPGSIVGYAGKEDAVVSALPDRGRKNAAAVCIAPSAGQRTFACYGPAAAEQGAGAGQGAGYKPQNVVRTERIRPGRNVFVQVPGSKTFAGQDTVVYPFGN